ncbi:hypothetical protein RGUI_4009 [Rhodovulum sp. P5]|uniref:VPLPA-CTERM sorting domain-containing protein n=1 Tax=Rhodovulum sp. P5 TaxID=1564506 RepID=UPI0009C34639|nr:VPLPA-CTERM sorting domain-containing protein [Rhodovulum sp. P5]ARE42150.1 hypothetical protein RGUI_4009 [Rhodovulum sp. P5]
MKLLLPALGLAAMMAVPSYAETVTMTFDEVTGDYTPFDDSIGDSTYVDVTNRTRDGYANATVYEEHVEHWTTGYSELVDVAYASADGNVGELQFDVDAGYQITFDAFDFGNYRSGVTPRDASFRIYDSAWNIVWQQDIVDHTGTSVTLTPGVTLTGTAYFQWGTDWDIGIDNFVYTSEVGAPAVPLPAALPLLLAAFGGLGLVARQRHA